MSDALEPPYVPQPVGAFGATVVLVSLVLGTFLGIELIGRLVSVAAHVPLSAARELVMARPIFGALAQLATGAAILGVARRVYHPGGRFVVAYGLRPVTPTMLVLAALLGFSLQLPLGELGNLVEQFAPTPFDHKARIARILSPTSFADGLGLVLAVVALAPVVEELVFRGLLLPGIARGSGMPVGVVISTLGFALSHVLPAAVAVAFVGGLVLATLTYRSRSVLPAIAMHAAHNALPVLLSPRLVAIRGFNVLSETPTHIAPAIWLPSLALALAAAYGLWREAADVD